MQNQFNTFKQGMLDALPIALAFLFVFCAYGALAYTNRYSLAQALFSTAGIFAVPLQLILLITNYETCVSLMFDLTSDPQIFIRIQIK